MHSGFEELAAFFRRHRDDDHLVLATVVATEGSTYRKPGAAVLIAASGEHCGLISGGCLESDLVERAGPVFADGRARRVSYDLNDDDELIWGLGLGCGGAVHLSLLRLSRPTGFMVLDRLFDTLERGEPAWLALTIDQTGESADPAWTLLEDTGAAGGDGRLLRELKNALAVPMDSRRLRIESFSLPTGAREVMMLRVEPAPRLLICGAGPDAVPMARLAVELGWRCVVTDHRPAYARSGRFPGACEIIQCRPERLSETLDLAAFSAAIVMSHHLEHDACYLAQLAVHAPPYLGVLGPTDRRLRLERQLGLEAGRVQGPAGLDIGAELPGAIALSVLAEIHARLNGRSGAPLTRHA